jgi:hypothetical protein
VGKVRYKAPTLAEMRKCGLLGQDPVRPGHLGQSSALYSTQRLRTSRKISSSGRLSASIDFSTRRNSLFFPEKELFRESGIKRVFFQYS